MSLTSSLKEPTSVMPRFLTKDLPGVDGLLSNYRRRLVRYPAPVGPAAGSGRRREYRMLGHPAISCGSASGRPLASRSRKGPYGRLSTTPTGHLLTPSARCRRPVAVSMKELTQYESSDGQPLALDSEMEDRLVRLCHVASSFEAIFRHMGWIGGNSLGSGRPGATLDEIVDAMATYIVDDIRQRLTLAVRPRPFDDLRQLPVTQRGCGPVFDGSVHVGGADADFILRGQLIGCKATIRPERIGRAEFYELAGYLLLDYSDT